MNSVFLNKAALAIVMSVGVAWFSHVVSDVVVPHTAPAKPAFSLPGLENVSIQPYLAQASVSRGAELARQICASCHAFKRGASNGVGPNLSGVVGRPIASVTSYSYSASLRSLQNHSWTDQNLSDWLTAPAHFAPGTRMSLMGIPVVTQRADIIAYLHTLTAPLPAGKNSQ
ncbi:cytochrome c family protein [Acetobacter cibinongensis]|uniref:Cytochrome c n=1 Tax=Acetobacter cibinongensis TaxID=146475 RepID=A0A0D6N673_9PROT|nr:c-type cytochrome [Acetobacter cibinongensis]GAN61205.1 cytochrome c [Acetobacter cibinongensis]GEL57901.1 cytochrome c family protein [Acetobacter cibinongensis]